jgi:hypothetical protein
VRSAGESCRNTLKKGCAPQAAEITQRKQQEVSGRDFSRADKANQINVGFRGCGKLNRRQISQSLVTGHDFSHAEKANQINVGL